MSEDFIRDNTKLFSRETCSTCQKFIAVFKIIDSRICLYCLDIISKNSKLSSDKIHELDKIVCNKYISNPIITDPSAEIKNSHTAQDNKIESPTSKPSNIPRRRGRPKKDIR
jgi:hypothetical protein